MSQDQSEQNRSEEPTSFKLQRAREKGSVARGTDLGFFAAVAAFLAIASMQGPAMQGSIAQLARSAIVSAPAIASSKEGLLQATGTILVGAARPLALMMGFVFLVVLVLEIIQLRGLVFTAVPLQPDFNRLNPANGIKRVFSVRMLIETVKTLAKLVVYATLTGFAIIGAYRSAIAMVGAGDLAEAMRAQGLRFIAWVVLAAIVFAALDQVVARRDFLKKMRMSRREVKREHRDREGEPRLKQRRKELHGEFAKSSQSLRGIRGADVLIVNPTHYAVALRYDGGLMDAPQVVSRGANQFALRLRRLAFIYGVTVVSQPLLARALYRCEVNQPIPDSLFEPVAAIYRAMSARAAQASGASHV